MKTQSTFSTVGWDFVGETTIGTADIWKMGNCVTNNGYPIFSWQTLNAEPTSSVTSQTDVSCNGGNNGAATVSIIGGTPNYTYSWLPSGGTAATASSLAAGVYTCTITDANTCIKTQSVTITEPMAIVGSQTLTLCAGQSTTVGSNIYNTSGVFTDVLTAVNGCDSTVTTNLTIENPIDITTSANAETITATATGATYQWIDCNNSNLPIAGETNQSFTATANGNYAVVITQGLCSDTSACVAITTVGLKSEINNHTSAIKIMPNPSAGLFNIELQQNSTITITDALGRTVLTQQLNSGNHKLDLVNQSNGVYFININNTSNYKIIKQN
jgi:hypothetical protein